LLPAGHGLHHPDALARAGRGPPRRRSAGEGARLMLFGIEWDTTNDWTFAVSILPILLRGLWVTVQATALGFVIALVLGLVFQLLRMVPLKIVSWPVSFF